MTSTQRDERNPQRCETCRKSGKIECPLMGETAYYKLKDRMVSGAWKVLTEIIGCASWGPKE